MERTPEIREIRDEDKEDLIADINSRNLSPERINHILDTYEAFTGEYGLSQKEAITIIKEELDRAETRR